MKQSVKRLLFLLPIVAVVVFLDQWTKSLVKNAIPVGTSIVPNTFLGNFFQILHWKNTGAAFGIFQDANLILMILGILIIVVLTWYYFSTKDNNLLIRIGLSLAIGGAVGNLIDRIAQGYVTDFLSFGRFPIFNVGDSGVTVGVGLMVLALLLENEHRKQPDKEIPESLDDHA